MTAKVLIVLVILPLTISALSQNTPQSIAETPSPQATSACQSTFTSGKNDSFLQFCVTANGNVTEFQSPQLVEHIREGTFVEGYAICTVDNPEVAYYDVADGGDSGNWQAPVITQPKGPSTFPLKIARTTSDGNFTLAQAFTRNAGERTVKVTMSVTNNASLARDLFLYRYVDIDANNGHGGDFKNEFDYDLNGIWAYNVGAYGLALVTVPAAKPQSSEIFLNVLANPGPGSPCTQAIHGVPAPFFGDGVAVIGFGFFPLAAGQTKTVNVEYQPL